MLENCRKKINVVIGEVKPMMIKVQPAKMMLIQQVIRTRRFTSSVHEAEVQLLFVMKCRKRMDCQMLEKAHSSLSAEKQVVFKVPCLIC